MAVTALGTLSMRLASGLLQQGLMEGAKINNGKTEDGRTKVKRVEFLIFMEGNLARPVYLAGTYFNWQDMLAEMKQKLDSLRLSADAFKASLASEHDFVIVLADGALIHLRRSFLKFNRLSQWQYIAMNLRS